MNVVVSIASHLHIPQPTHQQNTERSLQLLTELYATSEVLEILQEVSNFFY
jgi:hypothetical protein